MNRYNLITLLTISGILIISCSSFKNVDLSKYSDALIVVKGAKDLHYNKYQGTDQLSYKVDTPYPANQELAEFSDKLESKGWKPLKEDYLNPGDPSSHVRGWTDFIDRTKKPERQVHQWLAQWESANKDVLWCTLKYSYPMGTKANLNNLEVSLSFIPAKLALEMKRFVLENQHLLNTDHTEKAEPVHPVDAAEPRR